MKYLINQEKINKKTFPIQVHHGKKPEYLFITHHGIMSSTISWKYFNNWVKDRAIVVSFDARVNGKNHMKAARLSRVYRDDFRDVVRWAKKKFPNLVVVVLGSSWGSSVVAEYMQKYYYEVEKAIIWSFPYNFLKNNSEIKKDNGKKQSKLNYIWKFGLMLLFNINTKILMKMNLENTGNNRALERLNRIKKPKPVSTKIFWAACKSIKNSNKTLRKINRQHKNTKLVYFQSKQDSFLKNKKLKEIENIKKSGVEIRFFNEGKHAFQWDQKNNHNVLFFESMWGWLENNIFN